MALPKNLDLDVDEIGLHGSGEFVARIAVQGAMSFTRDGAAPTITADCATQHALEAEVDRLKSELDDALVGAAKHFSSARADRAQARVEARAAAGSVVEDGQVGDGSSRTSVGLEKSKLMTGLSVSDVMTRDVRTLNENDKLSMAEELMKVGRFRHVVVLDDDGKVTGVVSHRDIFYSTISWATGIGRFAHEKALESFPVKAVMHSDPVVVAPETELSEAASLMMAQKIGCLPVMDGETLVGILTEGDFLAVIV